MRRPSRIPIMIGGFMLAAVACGRDTRAPQASLPNVEVPVEEPVSVPVRITAREAPPPQSG